MAPNQDNSAIKTPAAGGDSLMSLLLWAAIVPVAVLIAILFLCSCIGQLGFSLPWDNYQLWQLRANRLVCAAIVGAALASAGAAMQCMLRNALASPYVLGVSSGAGVGVLAGMMLFEASGAWLGIPLSAAAGAMITAVLVFAVANGKSGINAYSLLLTGIIFNSLNGAIMLIIYMYANPYIIADFVSWSMGSISDSSSAQLTIFGGAASLIAIFVLFIYSHSYNVLALGEDIASSSGIKVVRLRLITFIMASVLTALAVSLSGPIGFVGLIAPHICRMIFGSDHRKLILASAIAGAALLAVADTFCRSMVMTLGVELPVGVIMAALGGPVFLWLLRKRMGQS